MKPKVYLVLISFFTVHHFCTRPVHEVGIVVIIIFIITTFMIHHSQSLIENTSMIKAPVSLSDCL